MRLEQGRRADGRSASFRMLPMHVFSFYPCCRLTSAGVLEGSVPRRRSKGLMVFTVKNGVGEPRASQYFGF